MKVFLYNNYRRLCEGFSGSLAQLGEHLPYKQRVTGSSPVGPIFHLNYYYDGEVAQLARACGSYPQCRGFESPLRYFLLSKRTDLGQSSSLQFLSPL